MFDNQERPHARPAGEIFDLEREIPSEAHSDASKAFDCAILSGRGGILFILIIRFLLLCDFRVSHPAFVICSFVLHFDFSFLRMYVVRQKMLLIFFIESFDVSKTISNILGSIEMASFK